MHYEIAESYTESPSVWRYWPDTKYKSNPENRQHDQDSRRLLDVLLKTLETRGPEAWERGRSDRCYEFYTKLKGGIFNSNFVTLSETGYEFGSPRTYTLEISMPNGAGVEYQGNEIKELYERVNNKFWDYKNRQNAERGESTAERYSQLLKLQKAAERELWKAEAPQRATKRDTEITYMLENDGGFEVFKF